MRSQQVKQNLIIVYQWWIIDGNYVGETVKEPIRVRIEGPSPLDENFVKAIYEDNENEFINHALEKVKIQNNINAKRSKNG